MSSICQTPERDQRSEFQIRYNQTREDGVSLKMRSRNDAVDCIYCVKPCFLELFEYQKGINQDFREGKYFSGCVKQIGCGAVFAGLAAVTAAFVLAALQNPDDCLEACYTEAGKTICACVL